MTSEAGLNPPSCRIGCAACCIAPSISSPIPGMPSGKPAGERCRQLTTDNRCRLFGRPERPAVCTSLRPSAEMCGENAETALAWLTELEQATGNQTAFKPQAFERRVPMSDLDRFTLDRAQAVLLVIDVQQKLVPAMPQKVYRQTLRSIDFLVKSADLLQLPVLATEQYTKGLGPTVPELAAACRTKVVEKVSFGCCGEPAFIEHLSELGRRQVIVTGMEAHVCVWQTVLGLLGAGYRVHLVRDGIVARGKTDYLNALELARQAGAVVTTAETAVFQLLQAATAPEFKAVSALVKERSAEH